MLPEVVLALLLAVPLVFLAIQSVGYWLEFKDAKQRREITSKVSYPPFTFTLLIIGVLCMWASWLGGIAVLVSGLYQRIPGFFNFTTRASIIMQMIGLLLFYLGAIMNIWTLAVAGKYLRPAPSGTYEDHRLV